MCNYTSIPFSLCDTGLIFKTRLITHATLAGGAGNTYK